MSASLVKKEILKKADPAKALLLAGYFKTGKGQYGEGDKFLGLTVPVQRLIAKKFPGLELKEIGKLLSDPYHEVRLTALIILVSIFKKADEKGKKEIVSFYLSHTKNINNWDLVDLSARDIIGAYYYEKNRAPLFKLAASNNLWERRIAIISTFYFIARKDFKDSLRLAKMLLKDEHDLIHKALGWMLREIGKKDKDTLVSFLEKNVTKMPRTMLRYSIERFPEAERRRFLRA
ncbi:MAG: DNA alkylation repair protein [Candidatus Paceibacterota bacterium]